MLTGEENLMESIGRRPLKVGLFLPLWEDSTSGTVPSWAEVLTRAKLAEDVGFDSIWVPDHLLLRFPDTDPEGVWEGWSVLAALAASTDRVELGPLVACSQFRNPALLAKMADTVDEISGGRLILGLGAGWHEPEFEAFGYPFDRRASRFAEAVTIIHGLLRHGQMDFDGTYYQARDCELRPRGPRPAGPPIMIGGSGPRMLELAARFGDAWSRDFDAVNPGMPPHSFEDLTTWRERVDAACVDVGRDPATLKRTAAVFVDLPNTAAREGRDALSGSPEELAEGLRGYARGGFTHVQLWIEPSTVAGIEAFSPVLHLLDRN
jgi:probable F420-dependent oxidoreductase